MMPGKPAAKMDTRTSNGELFSASEGSLAGGSAFFTNGKFRATSGV